LGTIIRIFNVVIEIDRFDLLSEICSKLLEFEIYKLPATQAALYRNRAIAKRNLSLGLRTEEMWSDIRESQKLNPNDENTPRTYSNWLIEDGNYKDAIENCQRLIRLDPTDANYYILLSRAYSRDGQHVQARKVLELARSVTNSDIDILNLSDAEATVNKAAIRDDPNFLNNLNEQRQGAQCEAT
jgi:tetratricopeptide (TPR) repeat protein